MKILFDTNTVVDILGKTEDFPASYVSYDVTIARKFIPYICAISLTDIVYVLQSRKYMTKGEARDSVEPLLRAFNLIDAALSDCERADRSDMDDFEDALLAYSAFRHNIDFIVTRNKRDFVKSPVPALTPREFLDIYKPDWLEYEVIEFDSE